MPFTGLTFHCYESGSNFPFQFSWVKAKKVYFVIFVICILVKLQVLMPNADSL